MPIYQLQYSKHVRKDLRKLDKAQLSAVIQRIESLADDPRPSGCIRLQGGSELYRVRQGDYRIIYAIQDSILTVLVVKVGHRKEVYG